MTSRRLVAAARRGFAILWPVVAERSVKTSSKTDGMPGRSRSARTRALAKLAMLASFAVPVHAQEAKVDFAREVRPILSDRCYRCHGPDASARKAGLRLDERAAAIAPLRSGRRAITPGKASASELVRRIRSHDAKLRMPPPKAKLEITQQEIATLVRWIDEGAEYSAHWAFEALPERVEVPRGSQRRRASSGNAGRQANSSKADGRAAETPRNAIDHFVVAKMPEGLQLAPRAAPQLLARRASLSLTGLPPTLAELDDFDRAWREDPDRAWRRLLDRLLDSPRYGERMAADWLDVARYADTHGYQSDVYRATWPWRDWVIRAFADNLPYDDFLTWQLAGDLLPNATRDQVLATAFNRLHRQTNEGGSVEEEFRAIYVGDRTETMATAFLGLTLGCARCHDHKYDSISQREYFELTAFFDNIDESGLYSHFTNATPTPTQRLFNKGQREALAAAEARVAELETQLTQLRVKRRPAFDAWRARPERFRRGGAASRVEGAKRSRASKPAATGHDLAAEVDLRGAFAFDAVQRNTTPNRAAPKRPGRLHDAPKLVAGRIGRAIELSGDNSMSFPGVGDFGRDDDFAISLWLRPIDQRPRAVVLHRSRAWTDAGSRGYELLLDHGRPLVALVHFWPGNAIAVRAKHPIPAKRWTHVAFCYDGSSRAQGIELYVDGRKIEVEVVRDALTKTTAGGGRLSLTIGARFRDRGFQGGRVDEMRVYARRLAPIEVAALAKLDASRDAAGGAGKTGKARTESRAVTERTASPARADAASTQRASVDALFERWLERDDAAWRQLRARLREARRARTRIEDRVAEIMVMRELDEPRPTYVLERGAYDRPKQRVEPGLPAVLSRATATKSAPRNRLEFARWLTDPRHPLTARVAINRIWQMHFGRGLVETSEDFGSQGSAPSHPRLLDWLARRFVATGWDVKALHRLILDSATWRRSSCVSVDQRRRDPDNRMLARGPRFRLPAEVLRDQALFVSGLLVAKIGGPPVKPYQPDGLWREKSGARYVPDRGTGLWRRSLYTIWKRTSPPPSMRILDASTRDVCAMRRPQTMTPMQALLVLNDPQFVEAARVLAERVLTEIGSRAKSSRANGAGSKNGRPSGDLAKRATRSLDERRIASIFRRLTARAPTQKELRELNGLLTDQRREFAGPNGARAARELLAVGKRKPDAKLLALETPSELAAWTMLASTVLCYDEVWMLR